MIKIIHYIKKYPNPEIREEGISKKEVVKKYSKDWYKILNVNLFPPNLVYSKH